MGGNVDPEKSAIEVKALLRRLHPKAGNHKDRIRRISKFRTYVNSDSVRCFVHYIIFLTLCYCSQCIREMMVLCEVFIFLLCVCVCGVQLRSEVN